MMIQKPKITTQIWDSIQIPKSVTIAAMVGYLITALIGILTIDNPAGILPEFYAINVIVGGVMVATSSAGIVLAWTGRWWVERGVVIMLIGSLIGLAIIVWLTHEAVGLTFPIMMMLLIVGIITRSIERATLVFSQTYEPGKEPAPLRRALAYQVMEEEKKSHAHVAHRVADEERRLATA